MRISDWSSDVCSSDLASIFASPIRLEDADAMMMTCDGAGPSVVRRFEVFTGAGQRREWSREVKASIVAERYAGQEKACAGDRKSVSEGKSVSVGVEIRGLRRLKKTIL